MTMSIAHLIEAAEYLERRERGNIFWRVRIKEKVTKSYSATVLLQLQDGTGFCVFFPLKMFQCYSGVFLCEYLIVSKIGQF